ncbi:MAG: class I tRNA ligase family protein [Acidobacteriota bacterium]
MGSQPSSSSSSSPTSTRRVDRQRQELALEVRHMGLPELHQRFVDAGVERAFLVHENGQFTLSHHELLRPLAAFLELSLDFAAHEGVFIGREEGHPALFFAFVHDTRRGLSQGGLRYQTYDSVAEVLEDGLRLAQGMTRKNALAGLWWGGGKGILPLGPDQLTQDLRTPGHPQRQALFEAYARFVASLSGVYYTAEDIGTKTVDMDAMLRWNRFQTCVSPQVGGSGNPSPATARGVFRAMQAAWRYLSGTDRLRGVKVAVQGAGNVGGVLIDMLDDAGAQIWTCDPAAEVLEEVQTRRPAVQVVGLDEIYDQDVDVFAPCAIGNVVNVNTIPRLKVRLVCGAANNILGEPRDAERLRELGIAFVPDYLCNRMGITNCADEWQGYLAHDVHLAAQRVYPDTLRVLKHAKNLAITSTAAADELADIAASELNPMLGHRGRRIIDHLIASGWHQQGSSPASSTRSQAPFTPGLDEPEIQLRWEREGRFRGRGATLAAAPVATSSRPSLESFLSPLLMDVAARVRSAAGEPPCRRLVGSDHGGLGLQLAVERSLPYEREEVGRPELVRLCRDLHHANDAAVREQMRRLGVGFDPSTWLDPMDEEGTRIVRRLYFALKDAGLLFREQRLGYRCPHCRTVLVDSDVKPTAIDLRTRYTVAFPVLSGSGKESGGGRILIHTFYPELLLGAAAVAVRPSGPFAELVGGKVAHPLGGDALPVVEDTSRDQGDDRDARLLVPGYRRSDAYKLRDLGLEIPLTELFHRGEVLFPKVFADLVDGAPSLPREQARGRVLEALGPGTQISEGRWTLEAHRCRRCETLVEPSASEELFLDFSAGVEPLRQALLAGSVELNSERWKQLAEEQLRSLQPLCISRQQWWGHELPEDYPGREGEILSTWFTLIAWSLRATGWPSARHPSPVAEVFVDPELLVRWVLPSQLISLALTGRPAYSRIHVHGILHVVERQLEALPEVPEDADDEERFLCRSALRPMRRQLGNVVEPVTLVDRFGADPLRLGYLLCLNPRRPEVVTLSESHLRRARRALSRLSGKLQGLAAMSEEAGGGAATTSENAPQGSDLDRWILQRAQRAAEGTHGHLFAGRYADAAAQLLELVEEIARYSAEVADRRRGNEDSGNSGGAESPLSSVPATLGALVSVLHRGFEPLCPYLTDRLMEWARERGFDHHGEDLLQQALGSPQVPAPEAPTPS